MEDILETPETTSTCCGQSTATLTVKRAGLESEDCFKFGSPAIVGRFDPSVGPIDIDLGSIPEGQYVSRKHAQITCEDGVWKVRDLGSSNGTFILRADFERVEEAELEEGTEVAFGNARMVFHLGTCACSEAGPDSESEPTDQPEATADELID